MADRTEDDTSAWETINSTHRERSVSWGPQDDAVFAGIEAVRFSSPGWLSENQFEQLGQPGETERAWQRIRAHDESLPRDEEVAPDVIPNKKQTFAQRARRPRYDFTVEGAPLPKTRRASSSTIVSRVFTAASRSIRSLSTSSSALGRRLSSSARSVSDKVVTAVTHWPNGSVKKKIGRPLSSHHSGSLRLPSAHDAANVHRTDFTSTNRLSSADVGRLTLNNFGNPSSVMSSSPPVLQYEPASSTFADSVMPSLVAPRQRSPVKVLRRQPRANDFQALRASQYGRADIKDLFPDDDTTDDYGKFIAAAEAADNTSLRPYRVRELSSVVRHENSDNISAIIEDYLRGDSATMFTRGRTPTPVPPRSDVLSTPSILRSSAAFREDVAAHVAAAKATERNSARREPVRVFDETLLSPLQIRHKRDVKRIAGEDLYFF